MAAPHSTTTVQLGDLLARLCPQQHIDLAGAVTLPCPLPHAHGFAGLSDELPESMAYLARDPAVRIDPTTRYPWAHSVLVFAQRYTDGWPADAYGQTADSAATTAGDGSADDWLGGVSRYARGLDYHDVLLADIEAVLAAMARAIPGMQYRCAVDTGPYCEREYAFLAGLGFFGKNTCLIHERLGSGFFLGVALTDLAVAGLPAPGVPAPEPLYAAVPRRRRQSPVTDHAAADAMAAVATRCGTCTRCLDACPTGALAAPFSLAAASCLSALTIECRGNGPNELRPAQGEQLFGCDICQAVCPWNAKASRRAGSAQPAPAAVRAAYAPLAEHRQLVLGDLLQVDAENFRRRFRRTPLWRCHPAGLVRNALTVVANRWRSATMSRSDAVAARIAQLAAADPDPDVRRVARWALARIAATGKE